MNDEGKQTMLIDEDSIDIRELLRAMQKNLWLMALAAVICGLAAYCGAKLLITPRYQSYFTAFINNRSESYENISASDVTASKSLTSTYAEIIRSRPVVEEAASKMTTPRQYDQVRGAVSVSTVQDTQIIKISVVTVDPDLSYELAQAMESVSAQKVQEIVSGSSMMIVTHAERPMGRFSPNYRKIAFLGMMLGIFGVIAISVLMFFLDNRIKSAESLTERYGIPVMGTIHDLNARSKKSYGYYGKKGRAK